MEWIALGLTAQILLLAVSWTLFQKARAELSAHAAETPVLGELKALQQNIRKLLQQMEETAEDASLRLEQNCKEANRLLNEIERHTFALETKSAAARPQDASLLRAEAVVYEELPDNTIKPVVETELQDTSADTPGELNRKRIFALADEGLTPTAIARKAGISEGEIETLLSMRRC